MKRRNWRTTALFSLGVFLILVMAMIISFIVIMVLFRFDLINSQRREVPIIGFGIASIIIGSFFSRRGVRRMVAPILEISEATKEVAKGNFDITLKERSHATEINIMSKNFMLMAKELAAMETFRNDFISNVSHEFKTPLSAIEGYATLLQNKSLSEEKRDAYVAKILYSCKRLSSLTGNILQLSRLESQEIPNQKEAFSLDEQIRQIILMFENSWNEKNLELDIDMDAVSYHGNADLLAGVWQNLISNAFKYVPEGGKVRIILRSEPQQVRVFVSDNGVGMSEEVRQRVFEKFYQGDTSHSTDGNGLGLTLAKRITELHGGKIDVSSKVGKGTTFTVTLPKTELSVE